MFFLAYNFSEIFDINQKEGLHLINFALNYSENQNLTTSMSCLDFLSNILDDYFDETVINTIFRRFVSMKNVGDNGGKVIFTIMDKNLSSQFLSYSQDIYMNLVQALFDRI